MTRSLIAELDRLPPARQVLLIGEVGDRQDAAALPAMRKQAADGLKRNPFGRDPCSGANGGCFRRDGASGDGRIGRSRVACQRRRKA